MNDSGINSGLSHGRKCDVPLKEAFRPGSALLVTIPVERGHEFQSLSGLQSHTVDIGNEHQQRDNGLAASGQPELVSLLDGIDHVAAAVSQGDHLSIRRLRLEQVGAEVRSVERMADATQHPPAGRLYRIRSVGLERMAKSVIDRKKEPGIAPLRYDRPRQARGERIAVIDPGCFGRSTGLTGKSRAPYRAGNGYPVVLRRELLDHKGDARIVEADRHVHLLGVDPLAGNRGPDVGLVLVVGEHDLDWLAEHRAPGILDRHARSDDRAWAA